MSADLVPVGGFYVIIMAVLAAGLRLHRRGGADRARRAPGGPRPGWPAFATKVTGTVAGGYLLLMAVLAGFYYGVDRVPHDFLASAWTGCGMLAGIALAVFGAASWLAERRRRLARPAAQAKPPPSAGPAAD
jgi:hypothetical protein